MELVTYESKRKEAIKTGLKITKPYDIAKGAITGELNMKVTGNKGARLFTADHFLSLSKKPHGEMNASELKSLVKQAVLDISSEEATRPALYKDIYEEIKDASFPATLEVKDIIGLRAAFSVVGDGEAVPLADFKCASMGSVRFKTYAAGYSITEEWVAFNHFWKIEQANKALGQAYNAILDHIHLFPIISAEYKDKKKTNAVKATDKSDLYNVYHSLKKGLKDALARKNSNGYILKPSIALCNSSTAIDVMSAVKGEVEKGSAFGQLGMIEKIITYDGWEGEVNGVKYEFKGPADNEVFLIEPKRTFKALVKKEVTKLEQKGNALNLGNIDVVEFFIRAIVADVDNASHKVIVG